MSVENELYERWLNAGEAEKEELIGRLFQEVVRHAQSVVWIGLQEWNPDLAQEIAFAAFRNLSRFKGESKFSTWVHAIGRNKVKELLRNRGRWRKVFAQSGVVEHRQEEQGDGPDPFDPAARVPDFDTSIFLDELCKGLSEDEELLLRCKYENMSSNEIAAILETTTETVDSRWARLKPTLKEKVRPHDG